MENELYHHGVKGQKWGIRRYQNKDGSLTYAGKKKAIKMQDEYTSFTENKRYRKKDGRYTVAGRMKALKMKEKYTALTGKELKSMKTPFLPTQILTDLVTFETSNLFSLQETSLIGVISPTIPM